MPLPLYPFFESFKEADDPVSNVLHHEYFPRQIWDISQWFMLLTGALRIAAREPDATQPPQAMCLELWEMNPIICRDNGPSSRLQDAVKAARSSGQIPFTWADR